ncbi:hypothetical protein GQ53DRAFT_886547 [Thozetella sp. PMI_491]|nr:hypothetical protein GQ53DRAFT_886547 [Thozetella sp. PMI_491]
MAACSKCAKAEPEVTLKDCAKCLAKGLTAKYCCKECQVADWPEHKKICGKNLQELPILPAPVVSRVQPVHDAYGRLERKTWLNDRPKKEVYRLLIDSYRLRVNDNIRNLDIASKDIFDAWDTAKTFGPTGFDQFLKFAETKGLLPKWWDEKKNKECKKVSVQGGQFHCLYDMLDLRVVTLRYDDGSMGMQMRMFANDVYQDANNERGIEIGRLLAGYITQGSFFN